MQEAAMSTLNGSVPGRATPGKIYQVSLNHAVFYMERPFTCPVDDCHSSYRRKDHLTRHLLQHQGKLFEWPIENCRHKFSFHGNVKRHVDEVHAKSSSTDDGDGQRQYVCQEMGCRKVFKYPLKLLKHEASHVTLDTVETFCSEPGCMKHFTNEQCLKGDFVETDEQFRLRPRGGQKRKCPAIESLSRKRVVPPSESESILNQVPEYFSWLLSGEEDHRN